MCLSLPWSPTGPRSPSSPEPRPSASPPSGALHLWLRQCL
uniref:Uncharacterized protein n=1 Tax=Anguilla anguilla TaxID=7936 RepID=A0A0E9VEE8_ANGAN